MPCVIPAAMRAYYCMVRALITEAALFPCSRVVVVGTLACFLRRAATFGALASRACPCSLGRPLDLNRSAVI